MDEIIGKDIREYARDRRKFNALTSDQKSVVAKRIEKDVKKLIPYDVFFLLYYLGNYFEFDDLLDFAHIYMNYCLSKLLNYLYMKQMLLRMFHFVFSLIRNTPII